MNGKGIRYSGLKGIFFDVYGFASGFVDIY